MSCFDVIRNPRRQYAFLDLVAATELENHTFPGAAMCWAIEVRILSGVLEAICAGFSNSRMFLMSWLQELTPMDVKDFEFPRDPSGRVSIFKS